MTLDEIKQKYAGTYECQATNDYKPIAKASAQLSVASVATNSTINTGTSLIKLFRLFSLQQLGIEIQTLTFNYHLLLFAWSVYCIV